jgi:hypothetical protein
MAASTATVTTTASGGNFNKGELEDKEEKEKL